MTANQHYDAIVVGAGQAGGPFSTTLAEAGWKTALIEKEHNLTAAGVETDSHGFIKVNKRLETNIPGIFALGDVKGGPAFTHISYDDFRVLRTNLLHGGQATTQDRLVPYTVFIDPQLGRVGLTEEEARAQSRAFCIAKLPMVNVARAI